MIYYCSLKMSGKKMYVQRVITLLENQKAVSGNAVWMYGCVLCVCGVRRVVRIKQRNFGCSIQIFGESCFFLFVGVLLWREVFCFLFCSPSWQRVDVTSYWKYLGSFSRIDAQCGWSSEEPCERPPTVFVVTTLIVMLYYCAGWSRWILVVSGEPPAGLWL